MDNLEKMVTIVQRTKCRSILQSVFMAACSRLECLAGRNRLLESWKLDALALPCVGVTQSRGALHAIVTKSHVMVQWRDSHPSNRPTLVPLIPGMSLCRALYALPST